MFLKMPKVKAFCSFLIVLLLCCSNGTAILASIQRPHLQLVIQAGCRYTIQIITSLMVFAVICILSVLIRSYYG